jgi:hypothetical protein
MKMLRDRYPPDWEDISYSIREAAEWRCQHCQKDCRRPSESLKRFAQRTFKRGKKKQDVLLHPKKYCLTVSHLDQNTANNDPSNLLALCMPCHLKYDRKYFMQNQYAKREYFGQTALALFESQESLCQD